MLILTFRIPLEPAEEALVLWHEEGGLRERHRRPRGASSSALTLFAVFQVVASVVHQDNFSGFAPLQPQVRPYLPGMQPPVRGARLPYCS